jgi:hypothetical protein
VEALVVIVEKAAAAAVVVVIVVALVATVPPLVAAAAAVVVVVVVVACGKGKWSAVRLMVWIVMRCLYLPVGCIRLTWRCCCWSWV